MQVLTAALKPTHREAGLYLEEDEDFVYLRDGSDLLIATFHGRSATMTEIWAAADAYINKEICPRCGAHRANTIEVLGTDCGHSSESTI